MSSNHTEPFAAQSPSRISQIEARASVLIGQQAQACFRELILDWAAQDTGPLPTLRQAEGQVRAELEVLCRGLGRLAALAPDEVFPVLPFVRECPPSSDEWWW